MDGRITPGLDPGASHDVVAAAVEEQEEPGAARPIAMPRPSRHAPPVMPGLDPGIHGRCGESRARSAPIAVPPVGSPCVRDSRMDGRIKSGHDE